MANFQLRHSTEAELNLHVWRYLTFPKYVSMMIYSALWFAKLKTLLSMDADEGAMPVIAAREMTERYLQWEIIKNNPGFTEQIKNSSNRNVEDGRELTLANCWFCSEEESSAMWRDYAGSHEGVAVVSTIKLLRQHVYCDPQFSSIGRVQYVDLSSHVMSHYEANQAGERAFLKGNGFAAEREVRMTTMSIRGPMCVNLDGTDMRPDQYSGLGMNNFDCPGLYIKADLRSLIRRTVLAPDAPVFLEHLVRKMSHLAGVDSPVERSSLEDRSK
ncbi:DUF2971 domain-containing protein [Bradyrhizobium sp. F1.13.3]|uniref:DUF2971 domain-containing protein n=1 Tax=Bradyrhizobium sp. F1.13.3 TaxID=3156351 RepID=UPI003397EA9D